MNKKKKIIVGCSDFREMIETNAYYVDKSLLIRDIIEDGNKVVLLPRPRRFGKTLNISMLREFFDIKNKGNGKLFENLKIWQCDDEIKSEQGKYPVIFISFRRAKGNNWDECYGAIKSAIYDVFDEHSYLMSSNTLAEHEKNKYNKILFETALESDFQGSIEFLSKVLYRHHKRKVVILMDEYDAPIQSSYDEYYDKSISFMRGLMSGAFKDNSSLHKGIITGILRVSKESIFSGLNNVGVYSILHDNISDKFGFTRTEVQEFLSYYGVEQYFKQVELWYDGYKFGETNDIYNPWSILRFAMDWTNNGKANFSAHWANTSSNDLIKREIKSAKNPEIRNDILTLINGGIIEKRISENFDFQELKTDKDLVWSLFLYSGYLTAEYETAEDIYKLRIPNYELRKIFRNTIIEWFNQSINMSKSTIVQTINSLLDNRLIDFEANFKKIIYNVFSYHDTAKNHEYIYHAYIIGLLTVTNDDYIARSNRESGEGNYDIMLIPRRENTRETGVVIEIKQIEKQKNTETEDDFCTRINKKLAEANAQINRNNYCQELIDFGIKEENIVKAAIVFAGKEPFVNEIRKTPRQLSP